MSSLFNLDFDVDLYTKVYDHTRKSAREGLYVQYNTYSGYTMDKWLKGKVSNYRFHKFIPFDEIPRDENNRGLGTFTSPISGDGYHQISAGILMNWAVLVITK